MSPSIKFWGVRGSLPSALQPQQWIQHFESMMHLFFEKGHRAPQDIAKFIQEVPTPVLGGYGTHTTCVELKSGNSQLIIDGGSGLRDLSEEMMKGPAAKGQAEIHIFMTHFHWDHVLGLPFFAPHFIKGNKINYYAVQPDLDKMVKIKFTKPWFPVPFESLPATIRFHQLEPRKPISVGEFKITPYQLDHPDPCWGFRIEVGGKIYAHCVDTESTRTSPEQLGPDLPLYQGVDLMYFDAQYTLDELAEKLNWGHSAAQVGLEIAIRERVKNIVFAHHDPGAKVQDLMRFEEETRDYIKRAERRGPVPKWQFAHDGLEIKFKDL